MSNLLGASVVRFGTGHYRCASSREGNWFLTGFSPRVRNISVYIMAGFEPHGALLDQLGKFQTGKFCLDIKSLEDVDWQLERLVSKSVAHL